MLEISCVGENKNLKFNHVAPIDLDTIPLDEREMALKEFAEGSLGLEKCLRIMWENGLKTYASCAGDNDEYDIGYISMAEGVDVFSFLSNDLLSNDMIKLELIDNRQVISFGGPQKTKDELMQKVAEEISQGKKENSELIKNKLDKPLNANWEKERRIHFMRKAGLSDDEIEFQERGLLLNSMLDNGTPEEIEAIMPEYTEWVGILNQKLVEGHNRSKK